MSGTHLAITSRPLWRLAEIHQVDPDQFFRDNGLDPELLQGSYARYPSDKVYQAYARLEEMAGLDHLGLDIVKVYTPLDLHAFGVSFLTSSTLMEAFHRLDRYEEVINSKLDYTIVDKGDSTEMISEGVELEGKPLRIFENCRSALIVDMCRKALISSMDPLEVNFTYPEPEDTGDYYALFRCPLKFSQPRWSIRFTTSDLLKPLAMENKDLARSNDQVLDGMLRQLTESDIVSKIKRLIIDALPSGAPSEESIAEALHISPRTLNRRLADEDTSYRELLSEVRREMAEKYITDPTIPIAEISYLLGFSEVSSFSRAFKRWTGEPPGTFRANAA